MIHVYRVLLYAHSKLCGNFDATGCGHFIGPTRTTHFYSELSTATDAINNKAFLGAFEYKNSATLHGLVIVLNIIVSLCNDRSFIIVASTRLQAMMLASIQKIKIGQNHNPKLNCQLFDHLCTKGFQM